MSECKSSWTWPFQTNVACTCVAPEPLFWTRRVKIVSTSAFLGKEQYGFLKYGSQQTTPQNLVPQEKSPQTSGSDDAPPVKSKSLRTSSCAAKISHVLKRSPPNRAQSFIPQEKTPQTSGSDDAFPAKSKSFWTSSCATDDTSVAKTNSDKSRHLSSCRRRGRKPLVRTTRRPPSPTVGGTLRVHCISVSISVPITNGSPTNCAIFKTAGKESATSWFGRRPPRQVQIVADVLSRHRRPAQPAAGARSAD